MRLYKVATIPSLALTAGLGLAACGSQGHTALHAAPAPTKTVVEQKTRTVINTITQWKTRTVPGPTVTVTAAASAPVLPMSSGEVQITVTAPDGSVASITAPAG